MLTEFQNNAILFCASECKERLICQIKMLRFWCMHANQVSKTNGGLQFNEVASAGVSDFI